MTHHDDVEKVARFEAALNQFIERIAEDRYVLAVVQVGSLNLPCTGRKRTVNGGRV
jgi:hypothetical protein